MNVNRLHILGKESIIRGTSTAEVILLSPRADSTKQAAAEMRTMAKIPLSQEMCIRDSIDPLVHAAAPS